MEPKYTQVSPDEYKEIQEKMNKILDEHNCDMMVQSTIQILKREIPSSYGASEEESGKESNTETAESGQGDSGKPTE
jgi:division protein CdvB (Snf7/Vps24/ESCRT-III family)